MKIKLILIMIVGLLTIPMSVGAVEYTDWSTTRQNGRGGEQPKTQYKVSYKWWVEKTCPYDGTCTKTEDYTCTQGRNSNSCGCGINYGDPVSGYCKDVERSTAVVRNCSAYSGACPGGTKVVCTKQGGGKYQMTTYNRNPSRWYYYASCTKQREVEYTCTKYRDCSDWSYGTTDWQDNKNIPGGTTETSSEIRTIYRYPKTYTVKADYNDGKTVITGTYNYGATYTCPTNNVKKGYTLTGWKRVS